MSLSKSGLKQRIIDNLSAHGFATNDISRFGELAQAIADAVVDEIKSNAQVPVTGGSSSGTYKVR